MGMWQQTHYIDLPDCIHLGLYRTRSLQFDMAVFNQADDSFVGIINSMGNNQLFVAYHVDYDPTIGTVLPITLLETCPTSNLSVVHNAELLFYLMAAQMRYAQPSSE